MLENIKKLFGKKGKLPLVTVQLTPEQVADLNKYSSELWPEPAYPGMDDLVWFMDQGNKITPAVVKALKRDDKGVSYQVQYDTDSKKKVNGSELFKTKTDCVDAAIGQHWKEINRLYSGLLSAREVPQTVIDYTTQSVESHKSCIAFLESQLRSAAQ